MIISIHAPIVGCDFCFVKFPTLYCNFNPRTHRGVRRLRIFCTTIRYYFNPRTHRGVRLHILIQIHLFILFQSTHPSWGATSICQAYIYKKFNFNPRTHRGVRRLQHKMQRRQLYFNPRTHRGVRHYHFTVLSKSAQVFQSTHPSWGATSPILSKHLTRYNFNPRTHRGVRRIQKLCRWNT